MITIAEPEFALMRQYIEQHCGIHLDDGKEYLIETRLSDLVIENGCGSFQEFHLMAHQDRSGKLRDRIVDAMTTKEWRSKGFETVINEGESNKVRNLEDSVMYRMLRQKRLRPQARTGMLSDDFDISL